MDILVNTMCQHAVGIQISLSCDYFIPLGKFPWVKWMTYMLDLFSDFWGLSILSYKMVALIYVPTNTGFWYIVSNILSCIHYYLFVDNVTFIRCVVFKYFLTLCMLLLYFVEYLLYNAAASYLNVTSFFLYLPFFELCFKNIIKGVFCLCQYPAVFT